MEEQSKKERLPPAQEAPAEIPAEEIEISQEEQTVESYEHKKSKSIVKQEVETEATAHLAEEEAEKQEHNKNERALKDELDEDTEEKQTSRKNKGNRALFRQIMKEKDPEEEKVKTPSKDVLTIREELADLRDKLNTLKWDHEHGQINPAKKVQLDNLQKKYNKLHFQLRKALEN